MKKLYDLKCEELAEHFLANQDLSPAVRGVAREELASVLVLEVEEWIAFELPMLVLKLRRLRSWHYGRKQDKAITSH